jgi:hypothetical protein
VGHGAPPTSLAAARYRAVPLDAEGGTARTVEVALTVTADDGVSQATYALFVHRGEGPPR